jgi:AcrR family transcriptional regulator
MEMGLTNAMKEAPAALPRGPHGLTREEVEASQRNRLMLAFVELVSENGYHDVTIKDIVSKAGTAKGAFYASFTDKEDCFVQTFDMGAQLIMDSIAGAVAQANDPAERIDVGTRAYLQTLIDSPALVQVFLIESFGAGGDLTDRWIAHLEALASAIVEWRRESRETHPELQPLNLNQVVTAISGVNQMAWIHARRNGVESLPAFADELVDITIALLAAPFDTAPRQLQ